jgi:pimeloyl-ACP methyl ester carboxylesterase
VAELVVLESYLLKPNTDSDTALVFMHPIGGGAYLPMINALARAGHHVIYCNSRFRGTDSALLMEKVVQDLGAAIKDAKDRLGYAKVVLAGWSGGGSLSMFYQQQAQHPTVTASPSGDGPDLTTLGLIPADGIMLLAAHISRHGTLTEWLDASILDESDPTKRDPELDLYNPDNPNQPPYSAGSWPATGRRRSTATGGSRPGSRSWPNCGRPGGPMTSSASWCTAPWPTRAGWTPPSIPTIAPGHLLSGRSCSGEHEPGRPGALLQPAQLAVPVEL